MHASSSHRLLAPVALAFLALRLTTTAHAQLVADGATATLNNVTNNIAGSVTVGTNGSFTSLILTNGALLTNTLDGFIGVGSGANNNSVSLDGPNARWYLRDLIVGSNGSYNSIITGNGSVVQSRAGYLGYEPFGVGNNSALVTGAGSVWSNQTDLFVGYSGLFNQLVVSNGGVVMDDTGYVGYNSSAAQNVVVVTGSGSLWSNRTDFRVGQGGGGNTLLITNGGTVFGMDGGYLGFSNSAFDNRITTDGGTLRIANATGTGVFGIRRGTNVLNAGTNDVDQLAMTNGAGFFEFNGGTLITRGGTISNLQDFRVGWNAGYGPATWDVRTTNGAVTAMANNLDIGFNTGNATLLLTNGATLSVGAGIGFSQTRLGANYGSSNNLALIAGASSLWTNFGDLYVGYQGGGNNALVITNGGRVANSNGILGSFFGVNGNQATVTGANSAWVNSGGIVVGDGGTGNTLLVANGGSVANGNGVLGGSAFGATSNQVTVTGAGSVWTNSSFLYVGSNGAFNTLLISNGGFVLSGGGSVGYNSAANNNQATVSGTNSLWTNSGQLNVGNNGAGNVLLIANGGTVADDAGFIGRNAGANNNQVTVTGANSVWTNGGNLYVGYSGSGNALLVTNGGTVASYLGSIGENADASNNQVTVTGANSSWATVSALLIGDDNGAVGNQLNILNGGSVSSFGGLIGTYSAGASGNSATVSGAGSLWNSHFYLTVGDTGSFNTLLVTNGGTVMNNLGVIGSDTGANSNRATVTGTGSLWTNSIYLYVGSNGAFNSLLIGNGGTVVSSGGFIGNNAGASNNQVTVSGANSAWNIAGFFDSLSVGQQGSGNTLLITNGGTATVSYLGYLGYGPTASNNQIIVTGSNSLFSGASLYFGGAGSGNSLLITNGGRVADSFGYLGTSGSNNQVTVTGSNSVWNNSLAVTIGYASGAVNNQLNILNGGTVVSGAGQIGSFSASGNSATVSGSGSLWTNSDELLVGDSGSFNALRITNGGAVMTGSAVVGNTATSTNNLLTVGNATLTVTNATSDAVLDVRRGNVAFTAGTITADQLLLTNGAASRFTFNGGTLITRSATVSNGLDFLVGSNAGFAPATWDVRSSATPTTLAKGLSIGTSNANATLLITNGATLSVGLATNGYTSSILGVSAGSTNNLAIVAGPNSVWTNSYDLYVGFDGSFNTLLMANGGRVADGFGFIGYHPGASNNQVTVTGPNSVWTNSASLFVGFDGSFNTLLMTNGGRVADGFGYIGYNPGASNNQVTVTGTNSVWAGISVTIGDDDGAVNNQLSILNGGTVVSTSGFIGSFSAGASRNAAMVSGAGSLWINSGALLVGDTGSSNSLLITNGGAVQSSNAYVGFDTTSSNNVLTVGNATLTVTNATSNGVLDVRRGSAVFSGGTITADQLLLTNTAGTFTFNAGTLITRTATISNGLDFRVGIGTGFAPATWDVRSNAIPTVLANGLDIGTSNANATLLVTNGATLSVGLATNGYTSSILGVSAGSTNNLAIVTGNNSVWTNSGDLYVGSSGAFNTLRITNGGTVADNNAYIGYSAVASNNQVTVSGGNSRWTNRGALDVGVYGAFNALLITNGAAVAAVGTSVGSANSANNNRVTVTGANSVLTNRDYLDVGSSGSFNTLLIANGGRVLSGYGYIGIGMTGSNNLGAVTGNGSMWTLTAGLSVGQSGSGNLLLITNGGVVASSGASIGYDEGANNNQVTVTGTNSVWTNSSDIYVGLGGSFNTLLITNGGTVQAANATVGANPGISSDNLLSVGNGTLTVTNATSNAVLDVRHGSAVFNGGAITADRLLLNTGSSGTFTFNAGTLNVRRSTIANATLFTVGNGTSAATYRMSGTTTDSHSFANNLRIANSATLSGNGSIAGIVTIASGGTLSPGTSVGKIVLSNSPALQGAVVMEISKSGGTLTNDQIQVVASLAYGGSLTVSNLGPDTLTPGDSFQLFSATSYSGALSALTLPPLPAGLSWTNRLLVDGSLAVINKTAPSIGGLTRSGTNLIFNVTGGSPGAPWNLLTSTNVVLPLSDWTTNSSGVFDWLGTVTVTNGINLAEPQRYLRIQAP